MNRIKHLILKYLREGLTAPEQVELDTWLNESPDNQALFDALNDPAGVGEALAKMDSFHEERGWQRFQAYTASRKEEAAPDGPVVRRMPGWRSRRWAAAAVLVLLAGGSAYFIVSRIREKQVITVAPHREDVLPPSGIHATVTLGNGQTVSLDSTQVGQVAVQGSVKLMKLANGRVAYSGKADQETYNTLTNPRGSRVIDVTLADGTKVWLNAGSSLTYPVAFAGRERRISISGEGYFEVAPMASMPFIVSKGEAVIRVLGTHFNVNANEDEDAIRVTLLEGSVRVSYRSKAQMLLRGQQALIDPGGGGGKGAGEIRLDRNADIEQVMAWKNGLFNFRSSDIKSVIREVARWYDIEVVYQGPVTTDKFGGSITRTATLSQLLEILGSSRVHFRLDGKKLTVLP